MFNSLLWKYIVTHLLQIYYKIFCTYFDGPSSGLDFLNIFDKVLEETGANGSVLLKRGSCVNVDNFGFHHGHRVKPMPRATLADCGLRLVFQPPYSAHFNTCEYYFNSMKAFLCRHHMLQSQTKLLENFYSSMHTIQRNNTISTTTDLRYQIPLPPGQCCFLQMSKDQGCFRTHNNIASKGRGEGRTRYSENVRKNGLRM